MNYFKLKNITNAPYKSIARTKNCNHSALYVSITRTKNCDHSALYMSEIQLYIPTKIIVKNILCFFFAGEHPAAIQRGISSAPGGCRAVWWLAGSLTLSSNRGERLLVLAMLLAMLLATEGLLPYATSPPR